MAYLADIVVYSNTFEDHLRDLKGVFEKLKAVGITLNPEKAQTTETRFNLLGFTVDCGHITPNPEKLKAIREFLVPTDVNSLRRYLGMVNFYRQIIPNCASLQAPLTRLLRRTVTWSWGPEQEAAFRCSSKALADTAELKLPDLNKPFVIQTDASKLGLGAVLLQEHERVLGPVAFASRSLTPAEFRCVLVLALATCAFAGYLGYGGYSVAAPLTSSYSSTLHRAPVVSTLGYGHGLGYGYGLGYGHRLGYGYGLSGYGLGYGYGLGHLGYGRFY
ncbi:uncharacterized protein ISCGN_008647 [Ixodes scapularis]